MRDVWGDGVDWDEQLWRYMRSERFASLVDSRTMYFAAASQFADPFEGAVAVMSPDFPVDPRYEGLDFIEDALRQMKRLTKVNCWHRSEFESDAMWHLYAGRRRGVAICTTPVRVRDAFAPFRFEPAFGEEELIAGPVRYLDLTQVRLKVSDGDRFFHKHRAFEWEREFRLVISTAYAEENGVRVPEDGIVVEVDPIALISQIVLGPDLEQGEVALIMDHAAAAGLADRVVKSTLLGRPRYV